MPNPYITDEINDLVRSHKTAMTRMADAAQTQADEGVRAIQLWTQFVSKVTEAERTEAGAEVYARAASFWASAKANEARSLDALAASLGTTRQDLLDQIAAEPATTF